MNGWVEAPPPKPMGCFAKGCLILAVFGVVLGIACVAGIYWGFRHHSAVVRSMYWLSKAHAISQGPATIPSHQTTTERIQTVLERWNRFETSTRSRQPAQIELSADDLNDLIAADAETRGKVFASIIDNEVRVQTNVPMGEFAGQTRYYLTADVTIKSEGEQSLGSPRLSSISVNNQHLPADVFDWKYRSRRLRDYLTDSEEPWNRTMFEIRDGKVILRSGADH
jgi:hypothetical protein